MTRVMYDAIHVNVPAIPLVNDELVAGYVTGTADVIWTPADWARFPGNSHVTIDQGANGAPALAANVVDFESGAYTPAQADSRMKSATSSRPTIYAAPDTLTQIAAATDWRGDVWVPHSEDGPPDAGTFPVPDGFNLIGIQWNFTHNNYDESVVYDDYWPEKAPVTTPDPTEFAAPANLKQTAESVTVDIAWDAVAGDPASYTVLAIQLDGVIAARLVTATNSATINGLTRGWSYRVYVWANGGTIAPPHAVIGITV
jgi:hypothetical protein